MLRRPSHLLALLALAAPALAQDNLPPAPSAVIAQQNEALTRTPGSTFKYTPASTTPLPGVRTILIEQPTAAPLPLSLDDAIALGLQRNVRLLYDRANQREALGDTRGIVAAIEPDLRATFQTNAQEINLAAMGFKPSKLAAFGINPATFPTIVKVNTTQAQISASQVLFSLPDYELLRGTKSEINVVNLETLNSEGDLILSVGTSYLQVLADQSNVTNAQAQEADAKTVFDQATAKFNAGVGTHLDALRGQVTYQQRQQATISAAATLVKDTIQLNRIMGLPAAQALELTDTAPFAELAAMPLEAAKLTAYAHRKDFLSLNSQLELTSRELRAAKYQRYPTLAFNGFYGVLGQDGGLFHGVFSAEGSLKFPIFREAAQRGEVETIDAQMMALRQRQADLRVTIDAQIRTAMLDTDSSAQLVKVAQSNVDLAQQELSDERDRFAAGVDDNLPVVDAIASLTGAQAQLVQALYQYNVAKLNLARYTGVIETRYRAYLGK